MLTYHFRHTSWTRCHDVCSSATGLRSPRFCNTAGTSSVCCNPRNKGSADSLGHRISYQSCSSLQSSYTRNTNTLGHQSNRPMRCTHHVPLAEVASRKHEVLHLLVVPLHGARRAGRGICRWVAVLGCSTQVVILRVPFAAFSHATGKLESPHHLVFEITALHLFATMHLAQFRDAKRCRVENNNDNSQHVDVTQLNNTPTSGHVYKTFSYNNNK